MSSLGIFNKETKTYQKVAGTAEAAVVDAGMSDTSTNAVQNKVVKKYVDDGVKSSKKLQTYKYGSTTETYGNDYTIYAQWDDNNHVKMKCDNYTVETDYATSAGSANSASTVNGHTVNSDVPSGAKFTDTVYDDTGIQNEINTLKKSVSDGKSTVANAITAKGVTTATDATFDVMAENISKIETGGGELHGATISGNTEEEVLFGKDAQLILNEKVIRTATVNSDGTFSFTDIQEIGLYRVYASNGTESDYSDIEITPEHIINKTVLNVTIEFLHIVTWADGTWKQIKKMLDAHYNGKLNVSDYWATGDIREQTIMATSITTEQKVKLILGDFSHHKLKTPIGTRDTSAITVI